MAFNWSSPADALSCPVCQDYFKDPVLLPCSHSFCNTCVQRWWSAKGARECPLCKTVSSVKTPLRNLVLKNLCEAFQLEVDSGVNSGVVCRVHREKLKLYCLDHWTPVCVVCRDSDTHRNHAFIPVDEAANSRRYDFGKYLTQLKEKVKVFHKVRMNYEKTDEEIKNQAQDTEEKIKEEFKVLYDFLLTEEKTRILALREEEERQRSIIRDKLSVLSREMAPMESTIKTIEDGLKDEDSSFLIKADKLENEAQRPLPDDPTQVPAGLIEVAKYLGNMSFTVWSKMKEIVSYTPVILNPNTAHRELSLCEGLTSVRWGPKQPLAVLVDCQPERMEQHRSVLGCEGFISGTHSWDVEIGNNLVWAIGVISEAAQKEGNLLSGLWVLRCCNGKFTAFSPSCPVSVFGLKDRPQRVRVHLDMSQGELYFIDPDTNAVIHIFSHAFTDKMFPYMNTWNNVPLKILPLKLSVIVGPHSD